MSGPVRTSPAIQAEILKLARLLRREPSEFGYLEQVEATELRALREQITEVLFSANRHALGRMAAASRLLPIRVVALIGERAFGPVLAARIAGLLDPDRAVEMANTMPIPFLADVAIELDPRRASAVISRIPAERIAEISRELLLREEYVTMGRFVGHLGNDAVAATVQEMSDGALLRVGFVLEAKDRLDALIRMLAPERLAAVVQVAARESLWLEVLDLLGNVSPELRSELALQATELDDAALHALLGTARENGLILELLPLLPALPAEAQRRLAGEIAELPAAERQTIESSARAAGMTEQLALIKAALQAGGR